MRPIERLIKKLNNHFKDDSTWTKIPLEMPIRSHYTATLFRGGFSWQFKSGTKPIIEKYGIIIDLTLSDLGSCYTVTELLKYNKFKLFYDNGGWEIIPIK